MKMLTYFDVKNFAPYVHCPTYMSFGLQDPTCGHAMWQEPAWDAERAAFLKQF